MRPLLLILALAALIFVGVFLAREGEAPGELPLAGTSDVPVESELGSPKGQDFGAGGLAQPGGQPERTASHTTSTFERPSVKAREGRTILTGQIVDAVGLGIEGATVQLGARRRWSKAGEAQPFEAFGGESPSSYVGFSVSTDPGGWFVIDAPAPRGSRAKLFASASPFLSTVSLDFAKGSRNRAPLEAGVRDLGKLQFTACGLVAGAVLGETGAPLGGVNVSAIGADRSALGRAIGPRTKTAPDGTFELAHFPVGRWVLDVKAQGWVEERSAVLDLAAGVSLADLEFRLVSTPIVCGRVLAPDGLPIEGAAIEARGRLGTTANASSDEQGAFELALPRLDVFELRADHPAFVPLRRGERTVDKNTMGEVRITLIPRVPGTLRVVDDVTSAGLGTFGIAVVRGGGSTAGSPEHVRRSLPKPKVQAGGTFEVLGTPGVDLLIVTAPGYRTAHVDYGGRAWPNATTPPAGSTGNITEDVPLTQTIRLTKGASILGQAMGAGKPALGSKAHLLRLAGPNGPFGYIKERRVTVPVEGPAGSFRFDQLDPGSYELSVRATDGTAVVVTGLAVDSGQVLDLGVIELLLPGKIQGSVLASEGMDLDSLEISVVDVPGVAPAKVDEEGQFVLEGVPAGTRTIQQTGISMDLYLGAAQSVDVPSGGVASVQMDVRTLTMVAIEIDVELDGRPIAGAELRLVAETTWPARELYDETESHEIYLGNTDQDGHASGRGRLIGPMVPVLHLDGWNVLHHPTRRIDLSRPTPMHTKVRFESATAVIRLPASAVIPENGSIDIEVVQTADPRIRSAVTVSIANGKVIEARGVEYPIGSTAGPWTLQHLAPGDVTIRALVYDIAVSPHGWRASRQPPTAPPIATFQGALTLRAGAEAKATLR